MTDEQIIDRIKNNEIKLFDEIYNRYNIKLRIYIKRLLGKGLTNEDIEDVLQNTFLNVYKYIGRIDTNRKFSSYIYRIAHNEALNWINKSVKRSCISIDADCDEYKKIDIECDKIRQDEQIMLDEHLNDINFALSLMKKEYGQVIRNFYFDRLSYNEISVKMDIPVNTIGTLLTRARQELANYEIIK